MFELNTTADLPSTVGSFPNNLSVYYYEPKFMTFAAICGKNQVISMLKIKMKIILDKCDSLGY